MKQILRMPPPLPGGRTNSRINKKWQQREPAFAQNIGLQIIKDIDPYKAVGGDVALGGAAPAIMSRREHREFMRRNSYVEIGNEKQEQKPYEDRTIEADVRRAYEQVKGF